MSMEFTSMLWSLYLIFHTQHIVLTSTIWSHTSPFDDQHQKILLTVESMVKVFFEDYDDWWCLATDVIFHQIMWSAVEEAISLMPLSNVHEAILHHFCTFKCIQISCIVFLVRKNFFNTVNNNSVKLR